MKVCFSCYFTPMSYDKDSGLQTLGVEFISTVGALAVSLARNHGTGETIEQRFDEARAG